MIEDTIRTIRINEHVQHGGLAFLHGRGVVCVTLDGTCHFTNRENEPVQLSPEQLQDLYAQTYGAAPQTKAPTTRDTQFLASALMLFNEMPEQNGDWNPEYVKETTQMLAQYAYDLVRHTLHSSHLDIYGIENISDLTAWPAQEEAP